MSNVNMSVYFAFESFVAKLFAKAGYEIEGLGENLCVDFIAKREDASYAVEVKYSTNLFEKSIYHISRSLEKIMSYSKDSGLTPVLAVAAVVNNNDRQKFNKLYPKFEILDVSNILFVLPHESAERDEFISLLPSVVEGIEPAESSIDLTWLAHSDHVSELIKELKDCPVGKETSAQFEKACTNILMYLFADDLTLWREQKHSNNGLYRFDLLCRIKNGDQNTFWSIVERYFQSKYVIFEFKNYSRNITQKEVYTTEKYLYSKALRCVAIIITSKGMDKHAEWAAKGVLRETGKLILIFEKQDVIKMCEMKMKDEDPSEYLLDKLDGLLMELEK